MAEPLPFGAIRPTGWMRAQMRRDLASGFAARLDELTKHASNDLFRNRVGSSQEQMGWWDSETRGHWLLGLLQMAELADDAAAQEKARRLADELLATQDEDGYLGIYTSEWRYQHPPGENGELWGQSRGLLVLLTRYELTGEQRLLEAVQRAVDLTLREYGPNLHSAMQVTGEETETDLVGLLHGMMYVDVLAWLARLTDERRYLEAAVGLYDRYCALPSGLPNDDMRIDRLLEHEAPLRGHAVHTAEHLRALGIAAAVSSRADLQLGLDAAIAKIASMTTPSGALIGDECVHGLPGPDAGYEYCTILELLRSLVVIAGSSGAGELLDWAELLTFNAGQAARRADGRGVAYCSSDTRLEATAPRLDPYSARMARFDPLLDSIHDTSPIEPWARGGRWKISATHEDVAVCCNPNAIRLLPEYVASMWRRDANRDVLIATLYGPCEIRTQIAGTSVALEVETAYPFREAVTVHITPERSAAFGIEFRIPTWATGVEVEAPEGTEQVDTDSWVTLRRRWASGDVVRLRFATELRTFLATDGRYAIRRGPLRYVQAIDAVERPLGSPKVPGLGDHELRPARPQQPPAPLLLGSGGSLPPSRVIERSGEPQDPWSDPPLKLEIDGHLLVPIGAAMLRQATFAAK